MLLYMCFFAKSVGKGGEYLGLGYFVIDCNELLFVYGNIGIGVGKLLSGVEVVQIVIEYVDEGVGCGVIDGFVFILN